MTGILFIAYVITVMMIFFIQPLNPFTTQSPTTEQWARWVAISVFWPLVVAFLAFYGLFLLCEDIS